MVTIQNYVRVKNLEEAYTLNQKKGSMILGGMLWTKMQDRTIQTAIDLCELGLDRIDENADAFFIGAMVSLREIELHEGLYAYTQGAVRDALKDIVGVQFRNLATVGGSIWGRFGFSDVLTMFLAMDTYVELFQGGIIPLQEFAVKKTPGVYAYASVRNQRTDFPVLACAAAKVSGTYRISVGARPGRAICITDEEGFLTDGITEERAKQFAKWVETKIPTADNHRGSAAYRTRLTGALCYRLTKKIGEEQA